MKISCFECRERIIKDNWPLCPLPSFLFPSGPAGGQEGSAWGWLRPPCLGLVICVASHSRNVTCFLGGLAAWASGRSDSAAAARPCRGTISQLLSYGQVRGNRDNPGSYSAAGPFPQRLCSQLFSSRSHRPCPEVCRASVSQTLNPKLFFSVWPL